MENAPGLTRSRKTLAILLATVMVATTLQIPIFVQPSVSLLRLERNGRNVLGTIVSHGQVYYGFATITGSKITFAGIFDAQGVPEYALCVEMAPISDSPRPLRIPQCGGGGGSLPTAYAAYCNRNPTDGACDSLSYFDQAPCMSTPYNNACTTAYVLHLSAQDAINAGIDFAVVTFLVGVAGFFAAGPVGATAGIAVGLIGLAFAALYAADSNNDKSMDIWIPMDWTNYASGATGYGLYVATPHFWWKLYYNVIPQVVSTR